MKLRFEITVDADRSAVWDAFVDAEILRRWQPSLVAHRHRSGEPGQPGSVSERVYDEGGRQVVMTETITERRPPDFMAGIYETRQITMLTFNTFEATDDGRTRWNAWTNMSFRGLMKFTSIFSIGSLQRRMEDDMQRFKLMVETDLASKAS